MKHWTVGRLPLAVSVNGAFISNALGHGSWNHSRVDARTAVA